jgi:hypothetical protein
LWCYLRYSSYIETPQIKENIMLHLHKWSKWESYQELHKNRSRDHALIAFVYVQKRICVKCGFIQYNTQEIKA